MKTYEIRAKASGDLLGICQGFHPEDALEDLFIHFGYESLSSAARSLGGLANGGDLQDYIDQFEIVELSK